MGELLKLINTNTTPSGRSGHICFQIAYTTLRHNKCLVVDTN